MRVVPINVINKMYSNSKINSCHPKPSDSQVCFGKGRECTKMLGAFCGAIGVAWAMAKTSSQAGEIDFMITAVYGIVGTILGAILGNKVDNDMDDGKGGFSKTA